jgi:TonB family protein
MNALINYAIEVNLGLILFYALYRTLLIRDTDFRASRLYLLASLSASLLFPFFSLTSGVQSNAIPSMGYLLPELIVGEGGLKVTAANPSTGTSFSIGAAFATVYLVITTLFLTYFLYQLIRLALFLRQSPSKTIEGISIIETSKHIPSFSFFNWIVIGQMELLNANEKEQILKHEMAHARQWHTADLVLVNVIRIFFWFNPIIWLYKYSLQQLHEFEADSRSIDEKSLLPYCTLLAKVAMAQSGYAMVHHFNKSLTLKRIKMMNTLKQQMKRWKVATAFLLAVAFFFMVACQDQLSEVNSVTENSTMALLMPEKVETRLNELKSNNPSTDFVVIQLNEDGKNTLGKIPNNKLTRLELFHFEESESYAIVELNGAISSALHTVQDGEIFTIVDDTALPAAGMGSFYQEIAESLKYPLEARQRGIEGRVFIEFVVNTDGTLTDFKILKGIHQTCDAEALRVVMLSKAWNPARHQGKVVSQRMVLPVTFMLGNSSTKSLSRTGTPEVPKLSEIVVAGAEVKK